MAHLKTFLLVGVLALLTCSAYAQNPRTEKMVKTYTFAGVNGNEKMSNLTQDEKKELKEERMKQIAKEKANQERIIPDLAFEYALHNLVSPGYR